MDENSEYRSKFERWIRRPPIEADVRRWPDDGTSAWPGNYRQYPVQLAWEAWYEACEQAKRER